MIESTRILPKFSSTSNMVDAIVSNISGKTKSSLSDLDYSRARGFFQAIRSQKDINRENNIISLSSGIKRTIPQFKCDEIIKDEISEVIDALYKQYDLTKDQLALTILQTIYSNIIHK